MLRLPTFGLALVAALGCSQATRTAAPVISGETAAAAVSGDSAAEAAVAATVTTVALEVPGMT